MAPVPSRGAHFQGCFAARDLTIGTQTSSHSSVGLRVPGLACNLCFLLLRRGRDFNLSKMTESTSKDELLGHQQSGKQEVNLWCRIRCQRQQLRWQPGSTGGHSIQTWDLRTMDADCSFSLRDKCLNGPYLGRLSFIFPHQDERKTWHRSPDRLQYCSGTSSREK